MPSAPTCEAVMWCQWWQEQVKEKEEEEEDEDEDEDEDEEGKKCVAW